MKGILVKKVFLFQDSLTALLVATKGGFTEVVAALLEHDPNVNATDKVCMYSFKTYFVVTQMSHFTEMALLRVHNIHVCPLGFSGNFWDNFPHFTP